MERGETLLVGSTESPVRFFRDHVREVYAFVSRATGADPSDVEDLVQVKLTSCSRILVKESTILDNRAERLLSGPSTWR